MAKIVYPLAQVLEIKKKRVEEAEKVVKEKQEALEVEKEKLVQAKAARDRVLKHQQDKLGQLLHELDTGTTSPKVQQMKAYLKVVKERLASEEKKVAAQKEQVKVAEENLAAAKEELRLKRQEVDKLRRHRKDWMREMMREIEKEEEREMDEIGTVIYQQKQRLKKE